MRGKTKALLSAYAVVLGDILRKNSLIGKYILLPRWKKNKTKKKPNNNKKTKNRQVLMVGKKKPY